MEGQSSSGQPQYLYHSAQWSRLIRRNTLAGSPTNQAPALVQTAQFPTPLSEIPPTLLPLQPAVFQAQLANYNKLISSGSSGRATRVQSSPLPPLLSPQHIQAVPRRGSTAFDNSKRTRSRSRSGHGNKNAQNTGNGERALITRERSPSTMSAKKVEMAKQLSRPMPQHQNSSLSHQSSSVPSTPHQHARQFSLGSREPSPNALPNHSPRSAYSESASTFPSVRMPSTRYPGCRYETAMAHSRRRMAYKIGTDKLEKIKPSNIKTKLSAEEEIKLTGDMNELYARLLPTEASESKRQRFVQKLEKLLNTEWPGHDIRVHMFGSSGNMLCTDESDVDICITTEWKELEGVCMLAELLAKHGMEKVICVSTAKVPIVKIWDPELELACDMNVNNTLALENTRMIKTYVQIDDRVRPLAMIIKHWTKRRIVNDAAFGGTLSSYTWICMIINFLQIREPPILPSLHQRPYLKLPSNSKDSPFADDLDALRGFGSPNKETLGELLFHFFRFYAHEMDYDRSVVSVRSGKLTSKTDKGWHITNNNRLCVEEPFNVSRNLGNTADDTSFRGLHLELRRAFELISDIKLDACCEEYIFPKEEERIWEKPPPQPRPVLSRSASQTRGGKGGANHRTGKHHNNNNRNGNNGRRASSGTFDGNNYPMHGIPPGMTQNEAWLQTQAAQAQLHNDLYTTFSVLQAQENSLRQQLYNQSQAYAQAHAQAQAQSFVHGQRLQPNGNITNQHATDRARGKSFDNPPLTAPIRPDMYFYPLQFQGTPMYGQQSPSTYPSSPLMSPALPESRRSLHRSSITNGSGPGAIGSNGSLRSQSQPAIRSGPSQYGNQYAMATAPGFPQTRSANGVVVPTFIADEASNQFADTERGTSLGESPPDGRPKEYMGYYISASPLVGASRESLVPPAIPAYGDSTRDRRRASSEQFPRAIMDRLQHSSRSPSPLGRDRKYSAGASSASLTPGPFRQSMSSSNLRILSEQTPLIVDGSRSVPMSHTPMHKPSMNETSHSGDNNHNAIGSSFDTPYQTLNQNDSVAQNKSVGLGVTMYPDVNSNESAQSGIESAKSNENHTPPLSQSSMNATKLGPSPAAQTLAPVEQANGVARLSPNTRNRTNRQNGGVSPLDIGPSQNEFIRDDIPHLSPVYEHRSPSPTTSRKFEGSTTMARNGVSPPKTSTATSSLALKLALSNSTQQSSTDSAPKSNGHTRGAKSEGGTGSGNWQKILKTKKKTQASDPKSSQTQAHSEQKPKNDSERKGG